MSQLVFWKVVPRLTISNAYEQEEINVRYSCQCIQHNHPVHIWYASLWINMKNINKILNSKLFRIFDFHLWTVEGHYWDKVSTKDKVSTLYVRILAHACLETRTLQNYLAILNRNENKHFDSSHQGKFIYVPFCVWFIGIWKRTKFSS